MLKYEYPIVTLPSEKMLQMLTISMCDTKKKKYKKLVAEKLL